MSAAPAEYAHRFDAALLARNPGLTAWLAEVDAQPVHAPESARARLRALLPAARGRILQRAARLEQELPSAERDRALEYALLEAHFAAAPLPDGMGPAAQVTPNRVTPRAREAAPAAAPASAIETPATADDTPPRRAVDPAAHVRRFAALGARLLALEHRGKRPRSSTWTAEGEPADAVERHVSRGGNYAVLCGRGLAVLDVDAKAGGVESLARLERDLGLDLSGCPTVWTGSGGGSRHVYLAAPDAERFRTSLREYPGLEFRAGGRGGAQYVVGPGSIHPSGEPYRWDAAALERILSAELVGDPWLPPAPAPLLDRYARRTNEEPADPADLEPLERLQAALDAIPTTDCRDYERWLSVGMSLHAGSGGDPDALAAWIQWSARDPKYQHEAADVCAGKWETFGGSGVTAATLYALAKEYAGAVPPRPEPEVAFDALPPDSEAEAPEPSSGFLPLREFVQTVAPLAPIVRGLMHFGVGVVFGREGTHKSRVMLSLALAIARGLDTWHGRKLYLKGPVAMIVGEGEGTVRPRVEAYGAHYGIDPYALPFFLRAGADFGDAKKRARYLREVAAIRGPDGEPLAFLVVDTLSSTAGKLDENTRDMEQVLQWCRDVNRRTGATVALIHHAGWTAGNRVRGYSGLQGNVDWVLRAFRPRGGRDADVDLEVRKLRQLPGRKLRMRAELVDVGPDPWDPAERLLEGVIVARDVAPGTEEFEALAEAAERAGGALPLDAAGKIVAGIRGTEEKSARAWVRKNAGSPEAAVFGLALDEDGEAVRWSADAAAVGEGED